MDTQDSSVLEPLAEVRMDMTLKGTATNKASEDGCKPTSREDYRIMNQSKTKEFHVEVSSEGSTTDKTYQDGRTSALFEGFPRIKNQSKTKEDHVAMSSKGTRNDKASQESRTPTKVVPTVVVIETYQPLFEAALKGDWKATEKILDGDRQAKTANVMTVELDHFTVLDVAVMAAQDGLVENLVKRFSREYKDSIFRRPLYNAAREGRIRMVKALVDKVDSEHRSIRRALCYAISYSPMQKEVIWYLARRTISAPDFPTMSRLIMAGHLDIALYLARRFPKLMKSEDTKELVMDLPFMKSYCHSGVRLNFWERFIYKCIPLCLVDTSFDDSKDTKMAQALLALNWFKIFLWNLATKPVPFIKRIKESKLRHKCSLEYAKLALTELKSRIVTPKILEF